MGLNLEIGCCGFPVSKAKYFQNFKVVELQQTFYQPPQIETAIKWREEAPADFEFTLKAWQLITHSASSPTYRKLKLKISENKKKYYGGFQPSEEVLSSWEYTDKIAKSLNAKIIVFQCPPSFTATKENLKNMNEFFKRIKRKEYLFCFEPRGESWPSNTIKGVCKDLDLVHCVDPFKMKPLFGRIRYFRLHGLTGYNYKYSESDLKNLLDLVKEKNLKTYVMFNNIYMFEDALRFKKIILNTKKNGKM